MLKKMIVSTLLSTSLLVTNSIVFASVPPLTEETDTAKALLEYRENPNDLDWSEGFCYDVSANQHVIDCSSFEQEDQAFTIGSYVETYLDIISETSAYQESRSYFFDPEIGAVNNPERSENSAELEVPESSSDSVSNDPELFAALNNSIAANDSDNLESFENSDSKTGYSFVYGGGDDTWNIYLVDLD